MPGTPESTSTGCDDGFDCGGTSGTSLARSEPRRKRHRSWKAATYAHYKRRRVGRQGIKWGRRSIYEALTKKENRGIKRKSEVEDGNNETTENRNKKKKCDSVEDFSDEGQENASTESGGTDNSRSFGTRGTDNSDNALSENFNDGSSIDGEHQSSNQRYGESFGFGVCPGMGGMDRLSGYTGQGRITRTDSGERTSENKILEEYCHVLEDCLRDSGRNRSRFKIVSQVEKLDYSRLFGERGNEEKYIMVSDVLYTVGNVNKTTEFIEELFNNYETTVKSTRNDRDFASLIVGLHLKGEYTHWHFMHLCGATGRGCRDWIQQCIRRSKQREYVQGHFRKYFRWCAKEDVLAFAKYICEDVPRRRSFILSSIGLESTFCGYQNVQPEGSGRFRVYQHVEISNVPGKDIIPDRRRSGPSNEELTRCNRSITKGTIRRANHSLLKEIEEKLLEIGAEPIDQGMRTVYWLENELFGSLDRNSILVKNALTLIETKFSDFSIIDYMELYNSGKYNPIFNSRTRENYSKIYYPCITSAKIILETLLYQCNNDKTELNAFLNFLVKWFNKETRNKNTLVIVGEPSAGKNYIFDSLKSWTQSCGVVTDLSKSSKFGLQDAINKRIAIWNEAVLDPAFEEKILDFLGGTETKVDVKFHPSTVLKRVPVLIMANYDTIPKTPRFESRCQRVRRWKYFPYLETLDKLIDPLSWNYVFNLILNRPFDWPDTCLRHYFM